MTGTVTKAPLSLLRAQKIANLTDTAIRIPFTGIRLGLDFLVGLIPGLGDVIMLCVAGYIVLMARKLGVPVGLQLIMLRNILIDFFLGLVPVIGDLIDIFYKANKANVRIMEKWWLNSNHAKITQTTREHLAQWQISKD